MQDTERGYTAYPYRGPTIHAVEGAVFALVALGWYSVRTRYLQTSIAETYILICFICLPLANLFVTSVTADNREPQAAHFSACMTVLLPTVYLVFESFLTRGATSVGADIYARYLLGNTALFPVYLAVTVAVAVLITLLAAGAVVERLWKITHWAEGSIITIALLQASLCKGSTHDSVVNLCPVLQGIALTLYIAMALRPAAQNSAGLLFLRPKALLAASKIIEASLAILLAVLTALVALTAGTSTLCLPVAMSVLGAVPLGRLLKAPTRDQNIGRLAEVRQDPPETRPPPQQEQVVLNVATGRLPPTAPREAAVAPAAAVAMQFANRGTFPQASEAVLFSNVGMTQTKKLL